MERPESLRKSKPSLLLSGRGLEAELRISRLLRMGFP